MILEEALEKAKLLALVISSSRTRKITSAAEDIIIELTSNVCPCQYYAAGVCRQVWYLH